MQYGSAQVTGIYLSRGKRRGRDILPRVRAKHIRAVHGKDAFGSETVTDFFDMRPELEWKRKKNFKMNRKFYKVARGNNLRPSYHPRAKDAMRGNHKYRVKIV